MKQLLWIATIIAISGLGILFWRQHNTSKLMAVRSCVLSIQTELPALEKEIQVQLLEVNRWNILSGKDYDSVISKLVSRSSLDCFGLRQGGRLTDPWHHELQIAVRPLPNGKMDFAVWSNGPDGVSQTADDILSQPLNSEAR